MDEPAPVTVVVPVGPNPAYRLYLQDCFNSIIGQEVQPDEILVIDDQAHLEPTDVPSSSRVWSTPWLSGVPHAFNFGVALARNNLVVMLGSDDRIEPWLIRDLMRAYGKFKDDMGYYWFDVQYSTGESQRLPCNCAATTRKLWAKTGGFPLQSSVGACDSILLSIIMKRHELNQHLRHVESATPPFWYRVHDQTVTAKSHPWQGVIGQTRDILTNTWEEPAWPRL